MSPPPWPRPDFQPSSHRAVHTRGMIKFARPDLIAGVSANDIEETAQILNHLARMLAGGLIIGPGQRFRVDAQRTLMTMPYEPDGTVPEVNLNNDALLLIDI